LSRIGGFSGLGTVLAVALFAGHETTVVRIDVRTLLLLANPVSARRCGLGGMSVLAYRRGRRQ
jgi:hypothetical protein